MSDFTTLKLQGNTASTSVDTSPTWTDLLFNTAGYELRANKSGNGAAGTTGSASWPSVLKPTSGTQVMDQLWLFSADTTGNQITAYDGSNTHYMELRISWDNLGTFASAPIISAWKDNTLPAASPGTQPSATAGGDGSSIVNGSSDTSNTSYLKGNAYGYGVDTGGTQQTPGAAPSAAVAVTDGTAGAVSPATGAWIATHWQSLQAATQYIQDGVTPKATTSGFWYFVLSLFIGANMTGGTLLPVLGFQYTWI